MIAKRSTKKGSKTRNDKSSLFLLWLAIPLGLTAGFFNANYQLWDVYHQTIAIVGLSVFVIGTAIRWISIIQLNKGFTVDVAITENHKLKTDGMYKNNRHPSYFGLILICFGLSIAMNSVISVLVISIPILLAILYRIKVEEDILIMEFGKSYTDYRLHSYKLIPKIY